MKKIFLTTGLIIVLLIGSKNINAQYYFFDGEYYDNPILYEAGISLNAMNCLTDLGGKKGLGTKFLKDSIRSGLSAKHCRLKNIFLQ